MLSALSFLTVVGRSRAPTRSTLAWFPLVGALIGAVIAAAYQGAHQVWPPVLAGAIVVAVDAIITGALHLDGLSDTADGLLPHLSRDRRLEVMADPTVGAFAAVTLIVTIGLRWSAMANPAIEWGTVIALWAASRTVAASIPAWLPYARPGGIATSFLGEGRLWPTLALIPEIVIIGVVSGWYGLAAVIAAGGGVVLLVITAKRRLGGFTGDILGASIVITETLALVALGAHR